MTDVPTTGGDPACLFAGAAALLDQLDHETARLVALRRDAERAETARARLEAALDALAPMLPPDCLRAVRDRVAAARGRLADPGASEPDGPMDALLRLLAFGRRGLVATAQAQAHVRRAGFAVSRTYAANTLAAFARRGLVLRAGRGRWRIADHHPDLIALRLRPPRAAL